MSNKLLEKEVELLAEGSTVEFKSPMKLEYYLVESNAEDSDELLGQKVYGIEIVKKVDGAGEELGFVKNLSCCREKTEDILNLLANNTVTPVGLSFVLDDIIGI